MAPVSVKVAVSAEVAYAGRPADKSSSRGRKLMVRAWWVAGCGGGGVSGNQDSINPLLTWPHAGGVVAAERLADLRVEGGGELM